MKKGADLVKPAMWQRMRTGSATKGAKDYDWAMIEILPDDTRKVMTTGTRSLLLRKHRRHRQRARDEDADILELIPVTIPELLRALRGTVIPEPRRD